MNMKKKKTEYRIFILSLIVLMTMGCERNPRNAQEEAIDTLYFCEPVDTTIPAFVQNIQYIPLQGSETHALSDVSKFLYENGKFYLGNRRENKIVVYDKQGRYAFEIDRRGNGNGEYLEMANFTVDKEFVYIIDNCKNRINLYDASSGGFKGTKPIDFVAWDMECLGEDAFLFSCLPVNAKGWIEGKQPRGAVWRTSRRMETGEVFFEYPDDYTEMVGKDSYFKKCGDVVVYHDFRHDGFYVFGEDASQPSYCEVKFSHGIDRDKQEDYSTVQNNQYNYLAETPVLADGYVAASISRGDYVEPALADKGSGRFVCDPEYAGYKNLLHPIGCAESKVVCLMTDENLYEEWVSSGFQRADTVSEQVLSRGGMCLLLYSFVEN